MTTVLVAVSLAAQFGGLSIAALGVRARRLEHSQRPGLTGQVRLMWTALLRGLGLGPRRVVRIHLDPIGSDERAMPLAVLITPPAEATDEQRLTFAVNRAIELQQEVGKLRQELAEETFERERAVRAVERQAAEAGEKARTDLDAAMAGSLSLEAFGLALAAIGAVLSAVVDLIG